MIRRINFISEIKSKYIRRALISFTIIPIALINCLCVLLIIPHLMIKNNKDLFDSAKLRWDIAKEKTVNGKD